MALTDFFSSMVTLHMGLVDSQPDGVGFHPRKVERGEGVAVRIVETPVKE